MPRFRVWLREHVLNFLRDPERKSNKRNSFRKSIMVSAPIPLGSLAIDMTDPLPLPTSRSVQDVSATHPLLQRQQTRYASADQLIPPPIDMIFEDDEPETEDDERPRTPPPTDISSASAHADAQDVSPTRRPALPTRNFSRRFSSRFSSHSANSVSSYGENDTKRMSQMSGVSAMSKAEMREEWAELRLSRRWSQRMSGAFESYQTHTRNYTPMAVI